MSPPLSWRCGTGHRCHVDVIFVLALWPCHCHCHHCHCCGTVALAIGVALMSSLLLHHGHVAIVIPVIIIITVMWPCRRCHHHRGTVAVATGVTSLSSLLWCGHVAIVVVVVTMVWPCHHCLCWCCGGIMMMVGSHISNLTKNLRFWDSSEHLKKNLTPDLLI